MSIKDKLMADMKDAMKAGQKDRLTVIRSLRAAIRQIEIDGKKSLDDDESVIGVISKELKMRKDSLEEFLKAKRDDLVDKTKSEINIITSYMPEQMSEDKIEEIVKAAIEKVGATTSKDMGKVMKEIMPQLKGKADGKVVNNIVQKLLK